MTFLSFMRKEKIKKVFSKWDKSYDSTEKNPNPDKSWSPIRNRDQSLSKSIWKWIKVLFPIIAIVGGLLALIFGVMYKIR